MPEPDRWRGPDRIARVAVIGSGLIGAGWVAAFLARGLAVAVYDSSPEAPEKLRAHLGRVGTDTAALSCHDDLGAALDGADFVQENTPERAEVKAALFAELDRILPPDVVVASSTSSLPITQLAEACTTGGRFVLGHPFNPVHLMPLVELGGGERTDPAAIEAATALYLSMGKRPVRLQREVFGHIANRLTSAMFREAVSLVASGAATVEDIDTAIRFGPALKWAIQGQFTTFHTSGGEGGMASFLDHFAPGIMQRWTTMTTPDLTDPTLRAQLVAQTEAVHRGKSVAKITQHQDEMLVALLRLLD